MPKKAVRLVLILLLLILGCANPWYISKFEQKTPGNGWEKCYSTYDSDYYFAVNLGTCSRGQMFAIDCRKYNDSVNYRLYVTINEKRVTDIHLFKFVNGRNIGAMPQKRQQFWEECTIKDLPKKKIFTKLPEEVQEKARLAIAATNSQYRTRSNNY